MKFNEAISNLEASDVEGVPKRLGKIVRRKVPAGYIADVRKRKKKKKKQQEIDELLKQLGPNADQLHMNKFWKNSEEKKKVKNKKKEVSDKDKGIFTKTPVNKEVLS